MPVSEIRLGNVKPFVRSVRNPNPPPPACWRKPSGQCSEKALKTAKDHGIFSSGPSIRLRPSRTDSNFTNFFVFIKRTPKQQVMRIAILGRNR